MISDTGIGMSKEFLKHIFEPFSQENSEIKTNYEGTGLGMSIVKQLVEDNELNAEIAQMLLADVGGSCDNGAKWCGRCESISGKSGSFF